ncbi:hypothetical protein DB346_03305 [Verrucomicrobia bacterium LW23]|nr:hypothetical protein DB346_03305 [Verrucomicrobia bacterium LW23]
MLAAAFSLAVVSASHAHLVWLEELPDKGLVLRFGDLGGKIETSPGYLDSIPDSPAFYLGEKGPELARATRGKDGITYEKATSAAPLFADLMLNVRPPRTADAPPSRTIYHARWFVPGVEAAAKPQMDLDIVPAGEDKLQVVFRGKPLAETKVSVEEPGGGKQDLATDKDGYVTFKPTKPGLSLVIVRKREDLAGTFRGAPYAVTSHVAVLSWNLAK